MVIIVSKFVFKNQAEKNALFWGYASAKPANTAGWQKKGYKIVLQFRMTCLNRSAQIPKNSEIISHDF